MGIIIDFISGLEVITFRKCYWNKKE